jgi:hypothetical protein
MSFWCLQIDPKNQQNFWRVSALASEKRLNQKNKVPLFFFNHSKNTQLEAFLI